MACKLFVLALCLASCHATSLRCNFKYNNNQDYYCEGSITTTKNDYTVDALLGTHAQGRSNDDVYAVQFIGGSMEVLPKNLNTWFKNYRELTLFNITNFPNFKRSQWGEYKQLERLVFKGLPGVAVIPKDALWDLTYLKVLYFEKMSNLQNFDGDFLSRFRSLTTFGVTSSPKITAIPNGFFRNQANSLQAVIFDGTNLRNISYSAFSGLQKLIIAKFMHAGCLDIAYNKSNIAKLTADIRKNCKDATIGRRNRILKKKNRVYSSSSSSSINSSDSSDY